MRVMYNKTGVERKQLVTAIAEVLGHPMNYKGAPTFEYAVGDYIIDKLGTLIIPAHVDNDVVERLLEQLYMKGFHYEAREDDTPDNEPITLDAEAPESSEPQILDASPGERPEEPADFTIELPLDGFTDSQLLNLEKLIASKASLIKKSLEIEALPIERITDRLVFPWFRRELTGLEIKTYTHLIAALCETAKRQKRVTATDKEVTSERFAFRIFLLKLGFAGPDYAEERKLLYQNLSGDCAFTNTAKRDEHAARWREIRSQRRLSSEGAMDTAFESSCEKVAG